MPTSSSSAAQMLWNSWLTNKDKDAANALIQHYMYLVSFQVERISGHLPRTVKKDELKSFGLFGLFDALKKFEPDRDLKFDTYASFRIRGAIMDGLRKEDWLPRSIREKTKKIEQIAQELEQECQREPTADEIAKKMQIPVSEVETLAKDALFANILSIEDKKKDTINEYKEGIGYSIADDNAILPDEHVIWLEARKELAEGIKALNEKEQMVISLFYHDELTLTEIGQVLDLTTSRISQIHKKAIFKLKKTLQKIQAQS